MKTYKELRTIDVNQFIEKKGQLSYLSWTYAVDTLLLNDPDATWDFLPYLNINDTIMVRCEVTALGKTIKMQLPVMDNRNNAIINPDARKVSDAQMRCLVKAIACFGIGLYIYAGEDLPPDEEPQRNIHAPSNMQPSVEEAGLGFQANGYKVPFGSHKGRSIKSIFEIVGLDKLSNMIILCEKKITANEAYSGASIDQMIEFVNEASDYIIQFENQDIS